MFWTGRPFRVICAAKSCGAGNSTMDCSRYRYSAPPRPNVAIFPMSGTTCWIKTCATFESDEEPSGRENSRMHTRLLAALRNTRPISRNAKSRSGTFRMPKDMVTLSTLALSMPRNAPSTGGSVITDSTVDKFCASPWWRWMTSSRPTSRTFCTPRRNISLLGSTPTTAVEAAAPLPTEATVPATPSSFSLAPTKRATSAVPVARSNTLSPGNKSKHSLMRVCRQNWSRPNDIHRFPRS
mmetsp:Transcript_108167/g.304679  ORF Transcript_108167/g.304679 Transcript_108167/m.304679 type:complete len:239 (+) Transcript_108167:118-834(+)